MGEFDFEVEEFFQKKRYVSGHEVLNKCGSLLTHSNQKMKV